MSELLQLLADGDALRARIALAIKQRGEARCREVADALHEPHRVIAAQMKSMVNAGALNSTTDALGHRYFRVTAP